MKVSRKAAALAALVSALLFSGCAGLKEKPAAAPPSLSDSSGGERSGYSAPEPWQLVNPVSSSVPEASYIASGSAPASSLPAVSAAESSYPVDESEPSAPVSSSASSALPSVSEPVSSAPEKSTASSSEKPQPVSSSAPEMSSAAVSSSEPAEPVIRESILYNYSVKWGYNHISPVQQQIYAYIYNAAETLGGAIDLTALRVKADDLEKAYWAFDYDNPQFLELGNGYTYTVFSSGPDTGFVHSIEIIFGRDSSEVPQNRFNAAAQNIIAEAKACSTDYERLKYVHDQLVNNTRYLLANTAYETEADGPLVYGKSICEGYSKAFMYLAQSLGYECLCVTGISGGGDHMWNMVKLDGKWYHVDATWDDPVMSDGSDALRHNYFLISDGKITEDHVVKAKFFALPSAPADYAA